MLSYEAIIAAIGVFGGIFAWWLGKFLTDKKDMIVLQMEVKYLKEKLDHLDEKIEQLLAAQSKKH